MIDHTQELLTQDAAQAKKLGLSYGKYKALQLEKRLPQSKQRTKPEKQRTNPEKDLTNIKRCYICGNPITSGFRRKYCTDECAMKANREYTKKLWHRKYGKNKSQFASSHR